MKKKTAPVRQTRRDQATDIDAFKVFLGPLAQEYTEVELRQLQREMNAMIEILLELYTLKHTPRPIRTIRF